MNRNQNESKEQKNFGQVTGLAVAIIFGLLLPWLFDKDYLWWPWCIALVLWLFAYTYPLALRPVSKAWLTVGHWLGWFNTRVILGLMYYTIFFITGLAMRLMGKDPMARKLDDSIESYRVKSCIRSKNHVERPF
jgi:hypothetical protein